MSSKLATSLVAANEPFACPLPLHIEVTTKWMNAFRLSKILYFKRYLKFQSLSFFPVYWLNKRCTSLSSKGRGLRRQYTATSSLRLPLFSVVELSLPFPEEDELLSSKFACRASLLGVGVYIPGVGGANRLAGVVPRLQCEMWLLVNWIAINLNTKQSRM